MARKSDDENGKPKNKGKKRKGCLIVLVIFVVLVIIGSVFGGGSSDDVTSVDGSSTSQEETTSEQESSGDEATSEEQVQEEQEALFNGDESINELFNEYNAVNPDDAITAGEFSVYNHHGSDHTNQAIDYDRNGFEIVVSDGTQVNIQGKDIDHIAPDATKAEAFKWIRALYPDTTDDEIETAWSDMESDLTNNVRIEGGSLDGMELDATYQFTRNDDDTTGIEFLTIYKH